ncbi:MAG: hypothetical protein H6970_00270 [Gammaproteobacteria bacterium]|nr:hypothetical protein [Gammaproteobacteria bacterium]MCP5423494.1 hypothetical protein [Gammaproteobacteria bacterium]
MDNSTSPETRSAIDDRLRLITDELRSLLANYLFGVYRKCLTNHYLACFHAACLLLESKGVQVAGHEGINRPLSAHFIGPGLFDKQWLKTLSRLHSQQQAADFHSYLHFEEEDVLESLALAIPFLERTLNYLKVHIEDCDWKSFEQRLDGVRRLLAAEL